MHASVNCRDEKNATVRMGYGRWRFLFLEVTRRQFLAQRLLNVCYDIVDILDTYR